MAPIAAGLKRVFVVHGEPGAQEVYAKAIEARFKVPVTIPARGQSVVLD